jgi:hypothetical protein
MLSYDNEKLNLINMADTWSHTIEREGNIEPHIRIAEIWFIDE